VWWTRKRLKINLFHLFVHVQVYKNKTCLCVVPPSAATAAAAQNIALQQQQQQQQQQASSASLANALSQQIITNPQGQIVALGAAQVTYDVLE